MFKIRWVWLAVLAIASIAFDALLAVIYAASIVWIFTSAWLGVKALRKKPYCRTTFVVALLVPLSVYGINALVQEQVDKDIRSISESRNWTGAKGLRELLARHSNVTWITKTRLLSYGQENDMPVIKALGFPGYILRYNLENGSMTKYPW